MAERGSARFVASIECASCGASLAVPDPNVPEVRCRFCDARHPVPEEARQAHAIDDELVALLQRGRREVERILIVEAGADMGYEPIAVIGGIATGFAVGAWVGSSVGTCFAMVIGGVAWIVSSILFILLLKALDGIRGRAMAGRIATTLEAAAKEARCPRCGAPVDVPGGAAYMRCGHCSAELLAADGLLAEWTRDAEAVLEQWRARAKGIAVTTGRVASYAGGCAIALFVIGIPLGAFLYPFYLLIFDEPPPAEPAPPAPAERVAGVQVDQSYSLGEEATIRWASEVRGYSSQYGDSGINHAEQALGAPDVFPETGDHPGAWAPAVMNHGNQWLELGFPAGPASEVVIIANSNPKGLYRVDDLSDPDHPAVLWQGNLSRRASVIRLVLPEPRPLSALRLLMNTEPRGSEEIDAVGLR